MAEKRKRLLAIEPVEPREPGEDEYEGIIYVDLDRCGSAFWVRWDFRIETISGAWVWTVVKKKDGERTSPYKGGLKGLGDCVKDIYRYVEQAETKEKGD